MYQPVENDKTADKALEKVKNILKEACGGFIYQVYCIGNNCK